jgi:hypothetical protein
MPSWTEIPTDSELAKSRVLLVEICALRDIGLTAKAVVVDFVFKNIQPLKDRVYPTYLYTSVNDPTRITNKQISEEDGLSQVDSMLRGKASNARAPPSYSAWNLLVVVSDVAYEFMYLSCVMSLLCRFVTVEALFRVHIQPACPRRQSRPYSVTFLRRY